MHITVLNTSIDMYTIQYLVLNCHFIYAPFYCFSMMSQLFMHLSLVRAYAVFLPSLGVQICILSLYH